MFLMNTKRKICVFPYYILTFNIDARQKIKFWFFMYLTVVNYKIKFRKIFLKALALQK